MTNLENGLLAGFIATAVLSVTMVAKTMMGVMPELDVVAMLSMMMGAPVIVGWLAHFMIGTLAWGGGFAVLFGVIPGGNTTVKGLVSGVAAWLAMMIMVMPMAGAGIFGMSFGIMTLMMTLVLHTIFGAVLGGVFGARVPASWRTDTGVPCGLSKAWGTPIRNRVQTAHNPPAPRKKI